MTFKEIQEIFKSRFGVTRLADIARELDVTPQVVSNWKARNQVPYKYVRLLRKKIDDSSIKVTHANEPLAGMKEFVFNDRDNDFANDEPTNNEPNNPGPRVDATASNFFLSIFASIIALSTTGIIFF